MPNGGGSPQNPFNVVLPRRSSLSSSRSQRHLTEQPKPPLCSHPGEQVPGEQCYNGIALVSRSRRRTAADGHRRRPPRRAHSAPAGRLYVGRSYRALRGTLCASSPRASRRVAAPPPISPTSRAPSPAAPTLSLSASAAPARCRAPGELSTRPPATPVALHLDLEPAPHARPIPRTEPTHRVASPLSTSHSPALLQHTPTIPLSSSAASTAAARRSSDSRALVPPPWQNVFISIPSPRLTHAPARRPSR